MITAILDGLAIGVIVLVVIVLSVAILLPAAIVTAPVALVLLVAARLCPRAS
jgi:hypothetical protein